MTVCNVTVVIPNFNRTTLLQRALASIEAQTVRPYEVIIVDDHSDSDKLTVIEQIVAAFSNLNVTLLVNSQNSGANYSRNRGIRAAVSKYVAFLDSDDLWMPNKLELQMAAIEKASSGNNRPVLSGTGRYRINAAGEIIAQQFGGKVLSGEKIRQSNFIGTLSSIIVETWVARHVRGFNEALSACQDWDFFIRLSDYVQYVGIKEPLCVYVDHDEERITLNNKKRLKAHLFIYRNHIRNSSSGDPSSHAELFRNVAEDYQVLGNTKKANLYYARYRTLMRRGRADRLLPQVAWSCFYRFRSAPSIKAQRYVGYKERMTALMRQPNQKEALVTDAKVILGMITSDTAQFGRREVHVHAEA
jgi:glycosyltransferase involved in cell wall biosynthesis